MCDAISRRSKGDGCMTPCIFNIQRFFQLAFNPSVTYFVQNLKPIVTVRGLIEPNAYKQTDILPILGLGSCDCCL
jgi:hypothetical protein